MLWPTVGKLLAFSRANRGFQPGRSQLMDWHRAQLLAMIASSCAAMQLLKEHFFPYPRSLCRDEPVALVAYLCCSIFGLKKTANKHP